MSGGAPKILPAYEQQTMIPNIPNEQKQIFNEKMQNRPPPPPEQKPTLSFEYYQPQNKKPPQMEQNIQKMFQNLPMIAPDINAPYNYLNWAYPWMTIPQGYMQPTVVKNYTIQTDGVTGDHQRIATIYEDVMPQRKFSPSYTTLGERTNDYSFIRAMILDNSDGKDIDLHGMSYKSINSHIKIDVAGVNPYNTYKHSPNPYKGLPFGFLLFRSCYPIKHLERGGSVGCSKDSTALNVRLYRMTEGSFYVDKIKKNDVNIRHFNFDEWREIAFYEYMRENILKKKICPNFPFMFGYFISEHSMIDYDKLQLSDKTDASNNVTHYPLRMTTDIPVTQSLNLSVNQNVFHGLQNQTGGVRNFANTTPYVNPIVNYTSLDNNTSAQIGLNDNGIILTTQETTYGKECNGLITTMDGNKKVIQVKPDAYLGKSLLILTESPTYSIFRWASKIYQAHANVNEMINRGYHQEHEWMNVLFQTIVALYVMQINNIYIDKFAIDKNVFIKDLPLRGTQTEFWKYKIDGVDYYLPNHGYLVMIDSNFRDLNITNDKKFTQTNKEYKLNGKFYENNNQQNAINYKLKAFEMFKACFDSNIFSRDFERDGGVKPPDTIIALMSVIMQEISTDRNYDIAPYILRHFKRFINNRVGTLLKESEHPHVQTSTGTGNLKKGDIVVMQEGNAKYKFVMYLGANNGLATIISKDNPSTNNNVDKIYKETTNIPISSLRGYNESETIQQIYKFNDENLSEDGLLEVYIINNN
ncbi:hypothetical protein BMW23_0659 [Bodo saltans virus]|uniref:Uncharacterized protein n=1 Tax=Bodo saltans virus TaxID=2024608 RepID=A0A2H4UV46_9VIRU|nr:hypothetical protein QJ851_gp0642 [Bodo saltans virus]ATZ80705.1 hypothetical protein BMW23_0659 [Bodo saltans virus]